jgi:hypothetical protein
MGERDIFIKDTHRGLLYEDGVLVKRPTGRGGFVYSPGPQFDRFRELAAA